MPIPAGKMAILPRGQRGSLAITESTKKRYRVILLEDWLRASPPSTRLLEAESRQGLSKSVGSSCEVQNRLQASRILSGAPVPCRKWGTSQESARRFADASDMY